MKNNGHLALVCGAALMWAPVHAMAEQLRAVASFSVLGDLAKVVGGEKVDVVTLVGPDSDAHVYEPKPDDAASVAAANVVLINGLGFEGFIERLAKASATKAEVVEVSKGVKIIEAEEEGEEHAAEGGTAEAGHHHDEHDPHAFQSVPNVRIYVKNIADAYCAADAGNCDVFRANAAAYDVKLVALDADIRAIVASIPPEKRAIITSHDAFGYFAEEYGLRFLAPEGISTDSEASAADVAKLIDQLRAEKASALFVENISDPRLVDQISAETGIKIGGVLYSDALSAAEGPAATYVDMMRYNLQTIMGAISGS